MGYNVVQSLAKNKGIASPTLTSAPTDWTANVSTGNSIIVIVWNEKSPVVGVTSVTDSNGNTYTKDIEINIAGLSNEHYVVSIFHSYNIIGGNKPTLSVTGVSGGNWVAYDGSFWRTIPLSTDDGTFALEVPVFKTYYAGFGVVKKP